MAEFLTTKGTAFQLEKIIIEARTKLILVSPYLQISKTFYERLKDTANRNVSIKVIYGKDELKPNERNSLAELKNIELYFFENLHAKCYFNESRMVITSMNMFEFSEKNNREMGVLIERSIDKKLFEDAVNETQSIIQSSEQISLKITERPIYQYTKKDTDSTKPHFQKTIRGYCIRCESRIDYNPNRPYCGECYTTWSHYENADYQENVCHRCGQYEPTSMNRPQDPKCYSEWQKETNKHHGY